MYKKIKKEIFVILLYLKLCRRNSAEPDAGLFLQQYATAAGFLLPDLKFTTSTVTYTGTTDECFRRAWGEAWSERALKSDFATQSLEYGLATQADLQEISEGWREWADDSEAVWMYMNGEIVGTKAK